MAMIATWPSLPAWLRAFIRSQRILPEHSITEVTWLGSSIVGSPSTGFHDPWVKSDGSDTASLFRSMDFGVMTISGRWSSPNACCRSMWKWLAGVDGCAIVMASSAASWRKRSRRADEWSGPWPS